MKNFLQNEVTLWANETFPQSTVASKVLHLWEEIQEAFEKAISEECLEECADCGLILMHLASSLNVELPAPTAIAFEDYMCDKLAICKARNWGKPDANGVVHHVKEPDNA